MQQGGGGSQYGAPPPEMPSFGCISTTISTDQPEAASPISSRRPPNFDELVAPAVPAGPSPFQDDDSLAAAAAAAAGDDTDRGGLPGNRWPRQETLALLKIRSEMDSVFRDATLKGPLWEEVSRKLAELGYIRSAKKCKEKFENVHKYYKRTKEGRAGRQDGKSYRFFSQLEALHSSSGGAAASSAANPNPSPPPAIGSLPGLSATTSTRIQYTSTPISASPITTAAPASGVAGIAGISLSSNTSSEDSDDEDTEEMVTGEGRKRKHPNVDSSGGSSSTSRKMMAFFEGLMKQVMERQETMQQKFLETIEKREQERMIREEAWKRQEMARLNREHELMVQERAMAASRDAAVISFLQKITGQTISIPTTTTTTTTTIPAASAPNIATPGSVSVSTKPAQPPPSAQNSMEIVRHQVSVSSELGIVPVQQEISHEAVASPSSRWPKAEVHALIRLRSGLDSRYQETGPKGPLWEEISSEMMKLGYNRSSKRCKEKWENINKYFKKVKESTKKRPEDAKTCPYFHALDALYRKKLAAGGGGGGGGSSSSIVSSQALQTETTSSNPVRQDNTMQPPSQQVPPAMVVPETDKSEGGGGGGSAIVTQIPTSNGGTPPIFFEEASSGSVMKKPEDIMKELMEQQQQHPVVAMEDYDKLEEHESDNMEEDDEEDDQDEEDGKMQYEIQFQRPNVGNTVAGAASSGNATTSTTTTAATAAAAAGSYMAMVQ